MDTNALMMPVELGVRVFEELDRLLGTYEAAVPRACIAELEKLSDGGGEEATAAGVGLDLADRCDVVDHEADYADDALVELAPDYEYVVTNDSPLKDRLLGAGVPVISIRGRNQLGITEP